MARITVTPAISLSTVRQIIHTLVRDETSFRASAAAAGLSEPLEEVTERMLYLQKRREFEPFFVWLSRRASQLVSSCHWLVFGPQMELGREAEVPTFGQLQFLIQLVREERPRWLPFTRELIAHSVLGSLVEVVPTTPIGPSSEVSSTCMVAG